MGGFGAGSVCPGDFFVDFECFFVLGYCGFGEDVFVLLYLGLYSLDEKVDLLFCGAKRFGGDIDVERRRMGKANPVVVCLETADGYP